MRLQRNAACVVMMVAMLWAGCSQRPAQEPQPERPGAEDLGSSDAKREPIRETHEPLFTVVESRGTCAPAADNIRNVAACCNDQPCQGRCVVERGRDQVQCQCFEVQGGCAQGQICCTRTRRCEKLEACDWLP